jgi:hypothetical protein
MPCWVEALFSQSRRNRAWCIERHCNNNMLQVMRNVDCPASEVINMYLLGLFAIILYFRNLPSRLVNLLIHHGPTRGLVIMERL